MQYNKFMKLIFYSSIAILLLSINLVYSLEFQPIVGYEQVHKSYPVERTKSRFIYGARVLVGPKILSLEAEGTTGRDSESFPDRNLILKEKVYNGMLGLRSSVSLPFINAYVRAGGHVRKKEIEKTENGVITNEKPASYLSPYAGAGIYVGPSPLKLHAGVTAIFTGKPQSDDVEYQYTLGASIGF